MILIITILLLTISIFFFKENIKTYVNNSFIHDFNHNHDVVPLVEKRVHDEKEIFHVSGNSVPYKDANQVCKKYGASLATYDQLIHAYLHGAEWCNTGWTSDETGYYLTQKDTWKKLQYHDEKEKRNMCGVVGLNGGKFPVDTKLGVNCYGKRPKNTHEFEHPLLPSKPIPKKKEVKIFDDLIVVPYNREKWSRDDLIEGYARF